MSNTRSALLLSAQRALWGNVTTQLRSASIEASGNKIRWRCIFDSSATEEDFELVSIAGSEILADFSNPWTLEEEVIVIPEPDEIEDLECLVFRRYEAK